MQARTYLGYRYTPPHAPAILLLELQIKQPKSRDMTIEPKKQTLQQDAIVEALFEIRFSCNENTPGNLLPGVLYPAIREAFPSSQTLDVNRLPPEIRETDPNLRYAAVQRFTGDHATVNIGPRSFTVVSSRPYMGWESFKPLILDCLSKLHQTGFIAKVERYSLRYVNIISAGPTPKEQFAKIHFNGNLGKFDLSEGASQILTDIPHKGILNKVTISSNANAEIRTRTGREVISGLLLDIDSIQMSPPADFWQNPDDYIEIVHDAETDIFFGTATLETLTEYGYKNE